MKSLVIPILNMTAQRMEVPELFGSFHIISLLITVTIAVITAIVITRKTTTSQSSRRNTVRVLSCTGWLLAVIEIYKQLFLYYVVNGGSYDWWYFPFQLCSAPMYLCILLPFTKGRLQSTFMTFMGGYTFISALAALIYPEDFLRSYVSLTLHGFIWHGILLFISLVILISGKADSSMRGLVDAAVLFAVLCVIALVINMATEPAMQAAHASNSSIIHNYAAMFYLNPYHISPQPIVGTVQKAACIPAGLILYSIVIAVVSSVMEKLLGRFLRLDARQLT